MLFFLSKFHHKTFYIGVTRFDVFDTMFIFVFWGIFKYFIITTHNIRYLFCWTGPCIILLCCTSLVCWQLSSMYEHSGAWVVKKRTFAKKREENNNENSGLEQFSSGLRWLLWLTYLYIYTVYYRGALVIAVCTIYPVTGIILI